MKYYLRDLLPRLKKYSAELDHASFLTDKPWVVSGEEHGPFQKLIFRKDGRVHLSNNGNLTDGKWEYLPEAKALIIDYGENKKLFRHEFLDEAVLALKVDGRKTNDDKDYFLLSDENKVPDNNARRYLKNKYLKENNLKSVTLTKGKEVYLSPLAEFDPHSYKLSDENGPLNDGVYFVGDGNSRYEVKDGTAYRTQKLRKYANDIAIWQSFSTPSKGEEVIGLNNGTFEAAIVGEDYRIEVTNGKVAKSTNLTSNRHMKGFGVFVLSLILLFVAVVLLSQP